MTRYPATMPNDILHGAVGDIEAWCAQHEKVRPTLLDLALARGQKPRKPQRKGRR